MRHFYRCLGCLDVMTMPEPLQMSYSVTVAVCGDCGQHFEYLGQVRDGSNRLETLHTRCKCDDRCTSARGPHCDCQCGGQNHGAGMAGYLTVTHDHGRAPRVRMPSTATREKHLEAWRCYHEARQKALAERDAIADRMRREFVPRQVWDRSRALAKALAKGEKARTPAARLKALVVFDMAPSDKREGVEKTSCTSYPS